MTHIIHKMIKSRADGLELSVLEIAPEGKLRGIVQLVHGMSENKERYQPFMEYLAAEGFLTVIHDHRGHGASVRQKQDLGYMYGGGAEALLDDISLINETLRKKYPELPLILFGHSMGSLAVRSFVKEHDDCVDALIVCGSPSRNPALPLGRFLAKSAKLLFGGRHVCHFIESISFGSYAASELCGFTFTADAYLTLFELMRRTYDKKGWRVTKPELPILFVGGENDPCIGSRRKFGEAIHTMEEAGYRNVKGHLYPGMRHEILNETGRQQVFREIRRYLSKEGF